MLRPRDVTLVVPVHKEGEPWTVRLTHRPSGIMVEGHGATYDEARTEAQGSMEMAVEVYDEEMNEQRPLTGMTDVVAAAQRGGPYGYGR